MKSINIFPLTIFCVPIGFPCGGGTLAESKLQFIEQILAMRDGSEPPTSEIAAWTGDVRGHEFLHNDPVFGPLFDAFENTVELYLANMGLDVSQLNLYFTRSWAVVATAGERVNRHAHIQSHLSLAYYLQKPENGGRIAFLHPSPPNEFVPGLFETKMNSLFNGPRNETNSNNLIVDVNEGDLVIFPSRTEHATEPHNSTEPRISISSDVVVTLKESNKREFLLPDLKHWKKMGS